MKKVYKVYDEISDWFDTHRDKSLMEREYLNFIMQAIPPHSSILDLGCGTGEPIARYFIENDFKVTGVDGSEKMITLCKKRFPTENWIVADMRDIHLKQQFDAILACSGRQESDKAYIKRIDHLVITVKNVQATCNKYPIIPIIGVFRYW
jgi:ubiquinone/menaquinone biosynthesis C-methylase UbiE